MRCLFWNAPLWTPFESLKRVNLRKPPGIFIEEEGPRLFYGDATHLMAAYVKDLQMERNASGSVVMEWTAPARSHFDRKKWSFVPVGPPIKRRYVWSEITSSTS